MVHILAPVVWHKSFFDIDANINVDVYVHFDVDFYNGVDVHDDIGIDGKPDNDNFHVHEELDNNNVQDDTNVDVLVNDHDNHGDGIDLDDESDNDHVKDANGDANNVDVLVDEPRRQRRQNRRRQ